MKQEVGFDDLVGKLCSEYHQLQLTVLHFQFSALLHACCHSETIRIRDNSHGILYVLEVCSLSNIGGALERGIGLDGTRDKAVFKLREGFFFGSEKVDKRNKFLRLIGD
jgi:hypothetical protein